MNLSSIYHHIKSHISDSVRFLLPWCFVFLNKKWGSVMQHLLFLVERFGKNSPSAMKTINMDIMQNIFLMKHFTQCTVVLSLGRCSIIIYTHFSRWTRLRAETLKMGRGVKRRKLNALLVWIFVLKTANKPQREMKICAVWKDIKWM